MSAERHLIIQELILRPSGEWVPGGQNWMIARVAEGSGYWLQGGNARALNPGDGLVLAPQGGGEGRLRASQLGPLKLEWFTIQPQLLNGLLTVAEWRQLEMVPSQPAAQVRLFTAGEPIGQKFAHIAHQTRSDGLTMRCALLQLWASAATGMLPAAAAVVAATNKLRDRFRQHVGQMLEAELSIKSLAELAGELHCSERHFSRLFREEFGVPLRTRQTELRLQRAQHLLADSDAKIINVAFESGYRHLGLFNAMFKKRFGVTPSEWRQRSAHKKTPAPPPARKPFRGGGPGLGFRMLLMFTLLMGLTVFAQTNSASQKPVAHFRVDKYIIAGNSILSPAELGLIFTNVPDAFGTNVTIDGILAAATGLQEAYRERGYMTVVVGLPPQKLTNAEVTVKVTEAPLAAINITYEGGHYYSSNNVMRALPDLHTNILLNAKIFQRELDAANMSRDRQIYPVVGPGPEPGTSELTLKVKDRLPWHARLEINNDQSTPGTPQLRVNFSSEYDNLWGLEHSVGVQYSFSSEQMRANQDYVEVPFDEPEVANYSGYYRMPLGGYTSVQNQVNAKPGSFGYNEATHSFNLPPATGRPELTFYASRAVSDTGVQQGPVGYAAPPAPFTNNGVVYTPLSFTTNSAGQNVTLNEGLGLKLALPLPLIGKVSTTFSFGADFKYFQQTSYNTNENNFVVEYFDSQQIPHIISFSAPQPIPPNPSYSTLNYLPLNAGLNGSIPDKLGTTFFDANVNFNVMPGFSGDNDFAKVSYAGTSAHADYATFQLGADRVQSLPREWSVKLHADGQLATGALIGNEQYAMGGPAGVRGYSNGEAYGDQGWRVMVEPQFPPLDIGMFGNGADEEASLIRSSVFMDYGELYRYDATSGYPSRSMDFWGAGWAASVNLGTHLDARVSLAWPITATPQTPAGDLHLYFGVGGQF